jgi:hypothetical protein
MSEFDEAEDIPPDSDPKVGSGKNGKLPEDANDSASTGSSNEKGHFAKIRDYHYFRACWNFVTWTPKRCKWDPQSPPQFRMGLNLLFGFVSNFVSHIELYVIKSPRRWSCPNHNQGLLEDSTVLPILSKITDCASG